jgi:hypothetical protein
MEHTCFFVYCFFSGGQSGIKDNLRSYSENCLCVDCHRERDSDALCNDLQCCFCVLCVAL